MSRNIINGKRIARRFDIKEQAAEAYDKIVLYLYGEDAQLNYPEKKDEYLKLNLLSNYLNHINNHFYTNRKYGTTFIKSVLKWQARILYNRKIIYLGLYKTEEEAAQIVDKANILLKLNKPLNFPKEKENYSKIDIIDFFENVLTKCNKRVNVYLQSIINQLKNTKHMGAQAFQDEDVETTLVIPVVQPVTETQPQPTTKEETKGAS